MEGNKLQLVSQTKAGTENATEPREAAVHVSNEKRTSSPIPLIIGLMATNSREAVRDKRGAYNTVSFRWHKILHFKWVPPPRFICTRTENVKLGYSSLKRLQSHLAVHKAGGVCKPPLCHTDELVWKLQTYSAAADCFCKDWSGPSCPWQKFSGRAI